MSSDHQWFDHHEELLQFARVLVASDAITTPEEVIEFFERPRKWGGEHQLWDRAGRPGPPSSDDLAAARFAGTRMADGLRRRHAEESARWEVYLKLIEAREDHGTPLAGLPDST